MISSEICDKFVCSAAFASFSTAATLKQFVSPAEC